MRETIDRMIVTIREYWGKMSKANRIKLGILAGVVLVLAIVVVAVLTRTRWVVISDTQDAAITADREAALGGARIRTRTEGFEIRVPEDDLDRAQELLYEQGLVGTPVFGDDWLSQASGFGVTSQHARELYDLQLGDYIRTQLLQVPRISNALAIIKTGETSPFRIATNTRKPTAQVQVTLTDDSQLTQIEVQGIADLIKGAVPGIEYDDIYITDNYLRSYSPGDEVATMGARYDQRLALQNRLSEQANMQISFLLAPIFGPENLKVQSYVTLNFDDVTISKVEFDPPIPGNEEGMVRSSEQIYERHRNWANAQGIPGTDSNELGTGGTPEYPFSNLDENDYYYRSVVSTNFELNETRTAIEVANGTIEEFGITVLINSLYMGSNADDEEEIEMPDLSPEITAAVVSAIGVAPGNVSVQYFPFTYMDNSIQEALEAQQAREARERRDMWIDRIFTYGTILLLAVMVVLLVRSIMKTLRPMPEPEVILAADGPSPLIDLDLLATDDEETTAAEELIEQIEQVPEIDLSVEKSAGLEQIERFIEKDPAAVAQLLRNWLTDE